MTPEPPDMTHAQAKRWTSRRVAVVAGVVPTTIGASVLYASGFGERDAWFAWFALEAAIAGGLLGHLVWVCVDVRRRVTRSGVILAGLCLAGVRECRDGLPPPSPRLHGAAECREADALDHAVSRGLAGYDAQSPVHGDARILPNPFVRREDDRAA